MLFQLECASEGNPKVLAPSGLIRIDQNCSLRSIRDPPSSPLLPYTRPSPSPAIAQPPLCPLFSRRRALYTSIGTVLLSFGGERAWQRAGRTPSRSPGSCCPLDPSHHRHVIAYRRLARLGAAPALLHITHVTRPFCFFPPPTPYLTASTISRTRRLATDNHHEQRYRRSRSS
ncbi:hypothetical protein BU26DRAFT_176255 [Trematosphaeria pertusa]|uniref:Uncharacterized protein n=1 Tax=Trematosphaeria pertusa TaxID=390896 RepID=A0A6A6HTI7_9PLEO|nr:uncharacterized protein BU26DRAFT_176255 [Trematosphaeria pertusa]KAF2241331.1 hypothetical protein BU26DRAFT_176255 [Trematosphaeria pertusa]